MTSQNISTLQWGLVLGAVIAVITVGGCSLTLQLDECDTDSDCDEYGDNWTCSSDQLCEQPQGPESCNSNADCQQTQGDDWTCSDEGYCEPPPEAVACDDDGDCPEDQKCNELDLCQETSDLLGEPCELAAGDIEADDAFIVGVLLPLTGGERGFGQPLFDAITLAMADFNSIGGIDGRPVALLACDTQGRNDLAVAGAQHLADVGIEAVIGPDYSDQTLEVATEVTIDAEMTLVSPSATAAELTLLDDNNLVWRTTASDAVQGHALGELVNDALQQRPHYQYLPDDQIPEETSVAILRRRDDPYAQGLRSAVTDRLDPNLVNDNDRFSVRTYANEAAGDIPDYDTVASEVIADADDEGFGPDVIVIVGAAEAWLLAEYLEGNFTNPPLFIFADAARNIERADEAPESLLGRIWGTAPQNVGDLAYQPYTSFRLRYQENFDGQDPGDLQFVPNAFDALYVIGLGAAYGGFDGPGIADGIAQLSDGETHYPTAVDAQSAISELSAGNSIDFDGASGRLNFDEYGDPEPNPTALWCFEQLGELPEEGVILTPELEFTPRSCAIEEPDGPEENDTQCSMDSDCESMSPDNSSPICDNGTCDFECDPGRSLCSGVCVDTTDNPDHCGACDNSCENDEICDTDQCVDDIDAD